MNDQWIRNLGIGYILLRVGPRVRLGAGVARVSHRHGIHLPFFQRYVLGMIYMLLAIRIRKLR
jgi:hypothetical protein